MRFEWWWEGVNFILIRGDRFGISENEKIRGRGEFIIFKKWK